MNWTKMHFLFLELYVLSDWSGRKCRFFMDAVRRKTSSYCLSWHGGLGSYGDNYVERKEYAWRAIEKRFFQGKKRTVWLDFCLHKLEIKIWFSPFTCWELFLQLSSHRTHCFIKSKTFSYSTECHVHEWWNVLCSNWISFGSKTTYVSINRKCDTKTTKHASIIWIRF